MSAPIPFGKYYLLERINVGGMAEVFRAKAYGEEGFERLLAVKRLLPNIAADNEFIEMFIDEAKIAVQLNHANVAQIFDLGKVEESYFIALEHVHGKDLRAIFDRCRALSEPMPVPQACFIVMKICEGLDYAHNKRDASGQEMHLVHRDVSPQNVLVSYEGEVKLIDFGIAKAAGKASQTKAGILKGKFGYMSPEQVRGLPLDRRSDIFSVGIVLYELLTGERLFLGETDFATLEKVRNAEILPPSTYNRKIGDELEQITLKALAKDVNDRYQNAIDLHDDLQAYMYMASEFYSRKDLAGWMKRTFAREIEKETRKLETYRNIPLPESPPERLSTTDDGMPLKKAGARSGPALTWDDDEIETQIYDKPGDSGAAPLPQPGPADTAEQRVRPTATVAPVTQKAQGKRGWGIVAIIAVLLLGIGGTVFAMQYMRGKAPAQVSLTALPGDGELMVDGVKQAYTGLTHSLELSAGQHVLMARATGFQPWRKTITVTPGQALTVDVALKPLATAMITVRSVPAKAKVSLDGSPLGYSPMEVTRLVPGRHKLELTKTGFHPLSQDFTLEPGQKRLLKLTMLPLVVEITVKATPVAKAFLMRDGNEQQLGRTPLAVKLDPKYAYTLVLRRKGYVEWSKPLTFDGKPKLVIEQSLTKEGKTPPDVKTPPTKPPTKVKPPVRPPVKPPVKPPTKIIKKPPPITAKLPPKTPPRIIAKKPPKPVGEGTLLINTKPWTKIFIDGRDTGLTTPQRKIPLKAGKHLLRVVNSKFGIDKTLTIFIKNGKPTKVIRRFDVQ